ncbi:coil containing protein [Vibrio phage 1.264.O._10N.286.51.F2]|nr:coil containing protein [Vibrio phage 1.264.O._10N.286.51.F2]
MPLVLDPIQSGYNLSKINDNFQRIEDTWDEKLDRVNSGSFYNQMDQALDMNSNEIINAIVTDDPTSLVTKEYVDALFNAIDGAEGIVPIIQPRQQGDGVTKVFSTPATEPAPNNSFFVQIDGITQRPLTDFTATPTGFLTFQEAPPLLSDIDITYFEPSVIGEGDLSNRTVVATDSTEERTLGDRFADVVNVKDYGALGDGLTDDTVAIQAAFNADGNTIYFPESTYVVTTGLNLPANKNILGNGSTLDASTFTEANTPVVAQAGAVRSSTVLTSDVALGGLNLPLSDVSSLNIGDYILVRSTEDNSWAGDFGVGRAYRKQTFFEVINITGNIVTTGDQTNTTFESATTVVDILDTSTAFYKDLKVIVREDNQARGLNVDYSLNTVFQNIHIEGGEITGFNNTRCVGTIYDKCSVRLLAPATNTQYGIAVSSSDLTTVRDCVLTATRHAVAIVGDQCRRTHVFNSKLRADIGPDAHASADSYIYENCDVYGKHAFKIGGRDGTWVNCRAFTENGTIILADEIRSGNFKFRNCSVATFSSTTAGVGWSPIDLGRGTAAISTSSRGDVTFDFEDCDFELPNQTAYCFRIGNDSPYKVNMRAKHVQVDMPNLSQAVITYEGNPTGGDADFVILRDITTNSINNTIRVFAGGVGATGYDSTDIQYPFSGNINGLEDGTGIKVNTFGYITSENSNPFETTFKVLGTAASNGRLELTSEARFGNIAFRTGFDGSANPLTDKMLLSTEGYLTFENMPTSSGGLPTGTLWNDAGTIKIA